MPPAPFPPNEAARLEALAGHCLLDAARDPWCDDAVQIAAAVTGCPISMVSIVTEDRQWFAGRVGLDLDETPRDVAFCSHTILTPTPLVVPDATKDARFADNPLVTGPPGIRFYAGVPLIDDNGCALGSICAIDTEPREISDASMLVLRGLAGLVTGQITRQKHENRIISEWGRAQQSIAELKRTREDLQAEIARRDDVERRLSRALVRAECAERIARDQQMALDTAGIVAVTDRRGTILHVNDNFCAISGYSRKELIGQNHRILNSGTHGKDFFKDMYAAIGSGRSWRGEICNRAKDGSLYWVDTTIVPMLDADGRPEQYIALRIDITESKRNETSLRATSEALESFFTTSLDLLCITDFDGRFIRASAEWSDLLGYEVDELVGMEFIRFVHPDDVEQTIREMRALVAGEAVLGFRNRYRRSDGSYRMIEWRSRPEGGVIYSAARDVTEQEEREAVLLAAKSTAENANRAKSDFLANMSHEIRTPMTAILGFADLLDKQGDTISPEARRDALQTIRRNGEHLLSVINDVLDVSKIEAGSMAIERIPLSPVKIARGVVELLADAAKARGIELRTEIGDHVPELMLGDPTRLRQILLNLTGNAIKFTSQGSVTLRVNSENDATPPMLRVDVIDTGIGMTAEQCEIVSKFAAFTQADATTTRRFGGTGLGLRISEALARLMGGSLTLASEVDYGSTFSVRLPAEAVAANDAQGASAETPAPTETPTTPLTIVSGSAKPLKGRRVLLAEDGPDNQRLITWHLTRAGADVTVAENGRVALDAFRKSLDGAARPFDVIVMDMQMPEMDGYTAASIISAEPKSPPILALTAHAMEGDERRCLDAGCEEYLTKPINAGTLIAACLIATRKRSVAA